MITTTLKKIRRCRPCGLERGSKIVYNILRKNLGKNYRDNTPVKFSQIIESNNLGDAIWCLQSVCPENEKEVRLFATDCAEHVLHIFEAKIPNDDRPRKAIQAARDFAEGKITKEAARDCSLDAYAAFWACFDALYNHAARSAEDAALAAYEASWNSLDNDGSIISDAAWSAAFSAWWASAEAGWAAGLSYVLDYEEEFQINLLTKNFS